MGVLHRLFLEGSPAAGSVSSGKSIRNRVDYKEVLSESEFALFAKLRDLRKEISLAEAVPVYTVFTNEQLASMVQQHAQTKSDLEKITGVGDARIEKYGARFLAAIGESSVEKSNEADRETL